jgi:hypothetical protein
MIKGLLSKIPEATFDEIIGKKPKLSDRQKKSFWNVNQ